MRTTMWSAVVTSPEANFSGCTYGMAYGIASTAVIFMVSPRYVDFRFFDYLGVQGRLRPHGPRAEKMRAAGYHYTPAVRRYATRSRCRLAGGGRSMNSAATTANQERRRLPTRHRPGR